MQYQSGAVSPVGSIQDGWNMIKANYWMFVLMMLVTIIVYIIIAFILGLISGAITGVISGILGVATQNSSDAARMSAAILPQIVGQFISIFTNIILLTVVGVLTCGIFKGVARSASGGAADFGDLFSEFDKIQQGLIVAVIMSLLQFVIGIVMILIAATLGVSSIGLMSMIVKDGQLNTAIISGILITLLPVIIISIILGLALRVLTEFVYPLIADRSVSGVEAFMLSVKAGFSNFGGLLGLVILLGLMMFAGVCACLIGALFVAPIAFAATFAAYRSVFGIAGGNYQQTPPPPPVFGNQPGY